MGYAIALKVSMRTIHDPSAAMYSPADQSVEEFCKHQELLLPHTFPSIGQIDLDIGRGTAAVQSPQVPGL